MALVTIEGEAQESTSVQASAQAEPTKVVTTAVTEKVVETVQAAPQSIDKLTKEQNAANAKVYAGPAVRKLARELGIVLVDVKA